MPLDEARPGKGALGPAGGRGGMATEPELVWRRGYAEGAEAVTSVLWRRLGKDPIAEETSEPDGGASVLWRRWVDRMWSSGTVWQRDCDCAWGGR